MAGPNLPADQSGQIGFLSPGVSIAEAEDPSRPRRVMGFRDLVLFYVVTGISLRWIATAAAAGPSSIVIWIGAWLTFYTPLALSVIELSSRYPNEGGLYVWTKVAFGEFSGFISAWSYWACNLPYFPAVFYFAASNGLFMGHGSWQSLSNEPAFFMIFSALALTAATLLNLIGLDVGKWLHNIGALAMWIPALILVALGGLIWYRFGSTTSFTFHSMTPSLRLNDIVFWPLLIFAFGGCETGSFMGEEIKDPRRTLPWGLFLAGLTVAACYILGTVGVLVALPSSQVSNLSGLMQAISTDTARVGFQILVPIAAFLIALSNVGAAGAYLAASARLPFVAGVDRCLPPVFGALHPRWKTPWMALLVTYLLGLVFIFLGQAGTSVKGAYDVLASMSVITYFVPYLYLFGAMIKLQSQPVGPEVIRVPGGKPVAFAVAAMGFLTTLLTIVLSVIPQPDEPNKTLAVLKVVGGSAVMLGIGAGIYWVGKRRAARTVPTSNSFPEKLRIE